MTPYNFIILFHNVPNNYIPFLVSYPPPCTAATKPNRQRGLKASFGARTNDDVHNSIQLCPLMRVIIDTPHMQRLRGLKQLGVSEMTYVPTTHCRFEHSLGVAHLAKTILLKIAGKQPKLNITEKDIGEYAFSFDLCGCFCCCCCCCC